MQVQEWLATVPPLVVYLVVGGVIGLESLGIPLPGEIVLVSAALLASQHVVNPVWVAVAASTGAIVGDSVGYLIGRRGGKPLLARLGRRFPRHLGPEHVAAAERAFVRWGAWAVFAGRFVALLRILAGPLAGTLRMPYRKFLVANVLGGIVWAGGTTFALYHLGLVAERWLQRSSWAALLLAVLVGLTTTAYLRHRAAGAAVAVRPEEP